MVSTVLRRSDRTSELDDMSRKTLTERRWPGSASPVPQAHHDIATGTQQHGVVHGYGEGPD